MEEEEEEEQEQEEEEEEQEVEEEGEQEEEEEGGDLSCPPRPQLPLWEVATAAVQVCRKLNFNWKRNIKN